MQVGDIAKVLDISQEIAATLYRQVAEEQARFPGLSEIHIAITIYLNWLNNMLDFLNDLLRSTIAVDADDENAVPSHPAFLALVGEILNDETHGAGGPLVMQLLHRIDDSRVKIRQLREGFGPHLPGDLFEQMVCTYRVQQDKMARVLGVICEHGQLYKKRALAVLRWLKKQAKVDGVVSAVAMAFYTAAPAVDTLGENDPREVVRASFRS